MSKLRELIEKRRHAAESSDAVWKAERKVFDSYVENQQYHIADLIDAAQSQHSECKVLRCDVCAALVKLEAK